MTQYIIRLFDHHESLGQGVYMFLLRIIRKTVWMVLERQLSKFCLYLLLTGIWLTLQYFVIVEWSEDSSHCVVLIFWAFVSATPIRELSEAELSGQIQPSIKSEHEWFEWIKINIIKFEY